MSLISSEWLSYDGALCSHAVTISDNTSIFIHSQCKCYQLLKPGRTSSCSRSACYVHRVISASHRKLYTEGLDMLRLHSPNQNKHFPLCAVTQHQVSSIKMLTEFHEALPINICRYSFQAHLRPSKHRVRYMLF